MLASILKSLKLGHRRCKGRRIGSASAYLRRLRAMLGDARMAKGLEVTEADLKAAVVQSRNHLTWFDAKCASPAATWAPGADGKVKLTGEPLAKIEGEYELVKGSILDFDCVVTTSRRDRDGDVLDPKGAIPDPKMPLLWQHVPFQPVGRLVRLLDQTEDKLTARYCVLDTQLGRDAVTLIEGGALRISHGFNPIEYNPLKDDNGKDMGGWRINKYAIMEASLVSIPSNVDAEITAFSRGKLHHPLVKRWCRLLSENRRTLVKGGWSPVDAARSDALHLHIHLKGVGSKAEDEEEKERKAEDDEDEEDSELEEKEDEDEEADENESGDEGKQARVLGELIDMARDLAKDKNLPKEAQRRLGVVDGLMEDIEEGMSGHMEAIGKYAKARDLAGIFTCAAELADVCSGRLRSVAEEVERIGGIPDLPDGIGEKLSEISQGATQLVEAVEMMAGAGKAEDAPLNDQDGRDDDEPDDEIEEADEERAEDDEDEEDDDFKEEDDEDEELKAEDDDDDVGDENPNAVVDPEEENPGVPKGRALDRLIGLKLSGHKLTREQRRALDRGLSQKNGTGRRSGRSRRRDR